MPAQRPRVFSREYKEAAVRRILDGEKVSPKFPPRFSGEVTANQEVAAV